MARFLAAVLLLVLLVEGAPLMPMQAGGCSMPCCKRSGGKAACCPRTPTLRRLDGAAGEACRMVACDTQARESTSIQLRLPAILEGAVNFAHLPLSERNIAVGSFRPATFTEDPPTPPPRVLHV
jgi:hypothetical protein